MKDPAHTFQPGDRICGKDTELKGLVLKVLDEGWLMILETEFDMEMNIHSKEVVPVAFDEKTSIRTPPKESPSSPGSRIQSIRVDLHWEKIPARFKGSGIPLQSQLDYSRYMLSDCIQKGIKSCLLIHGKGEGILHQELLRLCKGFSGIKALTPKKVAFEKPHALEIVFH
ncbi:MAG: Smr/MutS family protein [Bacteroidota bacterium]|nr:Smr/MutS family protein [Bacteroidota bacterium]MDX5431140.1 Smr/MutS family protein [Bacteroidota bacterium]MDX5469887.1 Smr/MutS family protein [Bacteroidota bacterium]